MNDRNKRRTVYLAHNVPEKYHGHYRKAYSTTSAMKAIRAKCLDCCCWQTAEVDRCAAVYCPLWEYRFGRKPKPQGPIVAEQASPA